MGKCLVPWVTVLGALALAPAVSAGDSYYMIVFAAQRPVINRLDHTHSFGLFIKAAGEPTGALEVISISWMPKALAIKTFRLCPEPGINLDLPTTLKWCRDNGMPVSMWGPYQIHKDLYDRALRQLAHLQSGEVRYKAVDTGYRTARVSNCIHALSDLADDAPRLRLASPAWGNAASYSLTLHLSPWIIRPGQTHDWLIPAVGLSCWCLERRDLEHKPTILPLLRARWALHQLRQDGSLSP